MKPAVSLDGVSLCYRLAKQRIPSLKDYAIHNGIYYVDAHSQFKDDKNGMKAGMSSDTVHPNAAGYTLLSQIVSTEIERALKGEPPSVK